MKTIFVSRHAGAAAWAALNGFENVEVIQHLTEVPAACRVIGTLPVHLAAEVCRLGGEYWHLVLDLPPEARGRELSADDMKAYGATVERFEIWRHALGR